jgi:hypothetical protein
MLPSRVTRFLGLRRHPLRRGVDVAEAWLTVTVVALLALVAPLLAWYTGCVAYRHADHAARAAHRDRVQVNAVLLEDTTSTTPEEFTVARGQLDVRAQWYAPDATRHVGDIDINATAQAGTIVPVWIDAKGDVVAAPPRHRQVVERAVSIGVVTDLAVGGLLAMGWLAARRTFDRRRMARWQLAWTLIEPQWSGRRR